MEKTQIMLSIDPIYKQIQATLNIIVYLPFELSIKLF